MKYRLILLVLLTAYFYSTGQVREKLKKDKLNSEKFKLYEIAIKKNWFDSIKINFDGGVKFIDARGDTGKFGFIRTGNDNAFYNLVFPKKNSAYMNAQFKHPASGKGQLLIVIRNFWISQIIGKIEKKKFGLPGTPVKDFLSFCYLKAEYYLVKDEQVGYLGNVDTLFRIKKWIGLVADDLVKKSLTLALSNCNVLLLNSPLSSYSFPQAQLFDTLYNQINYPILKTTTPQKGIYLKYEDFLNNKPFTEDFEIKQHKNETYILCSHLDTSKTNAAWGYSDGTDIFKHINDDFYKMFRVQNTFEFAGPRSIRKLYTLAEVISTTAIDAAFLAGPSVALDLLTILSDDAIMEELVPYQLNIKEGTFY